MNVKATYGDLEKEISRLKSELKIKENMFNQVLNSISDGFFTLRKSLKISSSFRNARKINSPFQNA